MYRFEILTSDGFTNPFVVSNEIYYDRHFCQIHMFSFLQVAREVIAYD